jgi:hypothetical protein
VIRGLTPKESAPLFLELETVKIPFKVIAESNDGKLKQIIIS